MNHEIPRQMIAAYNTDRTHEAHFTPVQYYIFERTLKESILIARLYRGADKSLARPGRKQGTATEL